MGGSCPDDPRNPRAPVKFKLDTDRTNAIGWIISPSSGTTPIEIEVGLNPNTAANASPGRKAPQYLYFTTVDQTPPHTATVLVTVTIYRRESAVIQSVLSAASLEPLVSPGAVVLIRGTNLGPTTSATLDQAGLFPTTLGQTTVTFNGILAPILSSSATAIQAVVPYGLAGESVAQVVVTHYPQSAFERVSQAFSVPVRDTSLGIFNRTQSGERWHDIQNCGEDGCFFNSAEAPAAPGSIITLFATGIPATWSGSKLDGAVPILPRLYSGATLTIGGQPATILYAGTAPYRVWGMFQVNARIPEGIGSGPQPVVLTVGEANNASHPAMVYVQ